MHRHLHMSARIARGKAFPFTGVGKITLVAAILLSFRVSGEEPSSVKEKDADTMGSNSAIKKTLPEKTVFPGQTWEERKPEELGISLKALSEIDKMMKINMANGVLIKDGYLVARWNYGGPPDKAFEIQSATKSITSAVLGLALRDGVLPSLDEPVANYYPGFQGGKYTKQITARHLITSTSGVPGIERWGYVGQKGDIPPGLEHHYYNDHFEKLGEALTYVYASELRDVFQKEILSVINPWQPPLHWYTTNPNPWGIPTEITVKNGEKIKVNTGGHGTWWTAADLARVGYLYLNNGNWNGKQLLPESYVKETFTAIKQPLFPHRANVKAVAPELTYGLGWWADKRHDIWWMGGNGGQACYVWRKEKMVLTKVNDYRVKQTVDKPLRELLVELPQTTK